MLTRNAVIFFAATGGFLSAYALLTHLLHVVYIRTYALRTLKTFRILEWLGV